jgi:hypothetical protein
MLFQSYPSYNRYRTLKLADPILRGEDVYALQTALIGRGFNIVADGALGPQTANAIKTFQGNNGLVADGLAGPATQSKLARLAADKWSAEHSLAKGLLVGQLSHESGLILGNYSPRRADGSYDAGVAQRNTNYHEPRDAFSVPDSIELLGGNLRRYYDKFAGVSTRRRWELAAGAWNAPAYACWIAKYEEGATNVRGSETLKPGPTARATLEAYMDSATAQMTL